MSSPALNVVTGSFVGTGADLTIKTLPSKVKSIWLTNAASADSMFYQSSMADDSAFKRVAAGTNSLVTSNGVTPYRAADGAGFSLGADTDMNVSGELVHYTAICE